MKRLSEVACDLFHPIGVFFGLKKMNNMQVFDFKPVAYSVRTVLNNGEVWFVAKDVCNALGLDNVSMACGRLDDDEKLVSTLLIAGQGREVLTVNESGLYNLIFTSNKPEAKAFRKWVTSEVLPAIRKTGKYEAKPKPNKQLTHDNISQWLNYSLDRKCFAISDNLTVAISQIMQASILYRSYLHWCKINNAIAETQTMFGRVLNTYGINVSHKAGGLIFRAVLMM